jgi:hypothetical protein
VEKGNLDETLLNGVISIKFVKLGDKTRTYSLKKLDINGQQQPFGDGHSKFIQQVRMVATF